MAEFYETDIVCPFYKSAPSGVMRPTKKRGSKNAAEMREEKKRIRCEGISKGVVLMQSFPSLTEKEAFKESFCASNCWKGCPIAIMLTETKYK